MKVEELIIDGFKSYAVRTVVSGWNPQFNAITGLNGSGKSNILDAICFVLGIASMSTVRASNLQDLIYKRGQAGVTKASVTIVFDNSDKEKSPIGFENSPKVSVTRQIVLGGTSKYLINGHKALQQTVLNLFQSVQLNINNPNFLIMQGKITKVLNMKPSEILSLVEEAAGTKTFEDRKDKALKTMAKKEAKLTEIRSLLQEEIEPKLERFRSEKRTFLEFQKVQTDLEKLSRVIASHNYIRYSERFHQCSTEREEHESAMANLQEQTKRLGDEIANLIQDLDQVKKQKETELAKGGQIKFLEKKEASLADDITRLTSARDLAKENERDETEKLADAKNRLLQLEALTSSNLENYASAENSFNESRVRHVALKEEYNKKEELLSTLTTGVTAKGGTDGGYVSQLKECKEELNKSQNAITQATMKRNHVKEKMVADESSLNKAKQDNMGLLLDIEAYKQEIENKERKFSEYGYDPSNYNALREQERLLQQQLEQCSEELNMIKREVGSFEFYYAKPYADFEERSVKGVVMELFRLKNNQTDEAMALQVCAGGRLYNVVVDNASTASALLERGQLRRRVTIIPLDKISTFLIPKDKVSYAKRKCANKVELALDLVDFEDEVVRAMTYVFGSTFICKDPATAKEVTFDPKIRCRSITLDGDIYDPEGNLSGGSRKNGFSVLVKMQKYHSVVAAIAQHERKLQELRAELSRLESIGQQTKSLQTELNLSKHELSLLQRKLETNPAAVIIKDYERSSEEIGQLESLIAQETQRCSELEQRILQIENDIKEFNQDKGSKLKQLEAELKHLNKQITVEDQTLKQHKSRFQELEVELDQQKTERAGLVETIEQSETVLKELAAASRENEIKSKTLNDEIQSVRVLLDDERAKLVGYSDEIDELSKLLGQKNEQVGAAKLSIQKLTHDLEKSKGSSKMLKTKLDTLVKESEWVTDTNETNAILLQYPDINIEEYESQAAILSERFASMKRKVNANIMSMIDNVEKKETSLKNMIRTIEKDKSKIEKTIAKLNEYKRETLDSTYQKVSEDFGNIFADLLPGSFAKLVPVNPMDVTRGLEIKVKLGPVWKESLVELSGGQRSLIALSLIMAFLHFKPAPMYILDEVDAALDLSHTQNIGHLIKTRFKGAQFIVVSLKEGMFTNANRVFRTRFQDGTSIVSAM